MMVMNKNGMQDLEENCIQVLAHQFRFDSGSANFLGGSNQLDDSNDNRGSTPEMVVLTVSTDTSYSDELFAISMEPPSCVVVTPEKKVPAKKFSGSRRTSSLPSTSSPTRTSDSNCNVVNWSCTSAVSSLACLLPTADDPIDDSFVICLDSPRDIGRINPVHIVVRRHVLEVRRTANTGRVFFQCACCKHRPRADRAKLSTLAPQGVNSIYRAFVRFMMEHVPACHDIPTHIRSLDARAKKIANSSHGGDRGSLSFGRGEAGMGCHRSVDGSAKTSSRSRPGGIKRYWAWSARKMGLMDGTDGKSIIYIEPGASFTHQIADDSD